VATEYDTVRESGSIGGLTPSLAMPRLEDPYLLYLRRRKLGPAKLLPAGIVHMEGRLLPRDRPAPEVIARRLLSGGVDYLVALCSMERECVVRRLSQAAGVSEERIERAAEGACTFTPRMRHRLFAGIEKIEIKARGRR